MILFYILNNGYPTDIIIPTRGTRQGDPLSPVSLLFMLMSFQILLKKLRKKVIFKVFLWLKKHLILPIFSLHMTILYSAKKMKRRLGVSYLSLMIVVIT